MAPDTTRSRALSATSELVVESCTARRSVNEEAASVSVYLSEPTRSPLDPSSYLQSFVLSVVAVTWPKRTALFGLP